MRMCGRWYLRMQRDTGRPPDLEQGEDQVVPLVFNMAQLRFERAGTYAVLVRIDGLEAARSRFRVVNLQPQPRSN